MTQPHDYAAALAHLNHEYPNDSDVPSEHLEKHAAIKHALKVADRLMKEPGHDAWGGLPRDIMMGIADRRLRSGYRIG